MTKKISGAEYPLAKIFRSEFDYVIPTCQRPYAWTPAVVEKRQQNLIDVLSTSWQLS